MAQSLVLSIDVYPGLGISPLQTNIWLSFSQADFGPRSAQDFFFGVFEKFETFFSKICAHSERYRNLLAGIFEIPTFYGNAIAFPLSSVLQAYAVISGHCCHFGDPFSYFFGWALLPCYRININ